MLFRSHLKIDTGMTRLGVMPQALPHFLNKLKTHPHLRLDGVMTHFADAEDHEYTQHQLSEFKALIKNIEDVIGSVQVWHVANSLAVLHDEYLANSTASEHWIRPGGLLYGLYSSEKLLLKPVMMLKSRVVMIKTVPSGTKISYGCTFETKRPSKIGVVPIGYADGYPWALSNKAEVLIRGKRAPIVGRVTMDMTMIDLTDLAEAHINDEVVLMGTQNEEKISAEELAKLGNTIPYEIFCGISKRMPRIYLDR